MLMHTGGCFIQLLLPPSLSRIPRQGYKPLRIVLDLSRFFAEYYGNVSYYRISSTGAVVSPIVSLSFISSIGGSVSSIISGTTITSSPGILSPAFKV